MTLGLASAGRAELLEAEHAGERAAVVRTLADLVGGRASAQTVAALQARAGFAPILRGADPESTAARLRSERARLRRAFAGQPGSARWPGGALRRLGALAEAEATTTLARPRLAERLRQAQLDLLRQQILPWVVPFAPALARNARDPVYLLAAEEAPPLLLGIGEDLIRLRRAGATRPMRPADRSLEGEAPLAVRVATPGLGGVVLSWDDLASLAASLKLPAPGGGSFVRAVEELFADARAAGRLADLCARLEREWRARVDRYAQWGLLFPGGAALCWEWRQRARATAAALAAAAGGDAQ